MRDGLKKSKRLEQREVNQKVDEELRKKARLCEILPPIEYDEAVNKILSDLPADEPVEEKKKFVFHMISKPVAAVIAFAIGISAIAVSGSVGYHLLRMKEMTDAELSEYNDMIQKFNLNKDSYSRKFSLRELERMVELQEAYTTEDRFPEGNVIILDKPEDWTKDTVAYYVQTRTFYLPEWELSDEELLEFVDFCQTRSYSVERKDSRDILAMDGGVELDDVQMADIVEAVKVALQMDVSHIYYVVETLEDNTEYIVTFIEGNREICSVSYGRETGKILYVVNISRNGKDEVVFDEAQIQKGYAQIQECLDSPIWEELEIGHATAEYYLHEESNTMWDGRINYLLEGQDGSGYLISYDCEEQKLFSVTYSETKSDLIKGSIYANSILEENDLTREIFELQ